MAIPSTSSSYTAVRAILASYNIASFVSYGKVGNRELDNLSEHDPFYKREDVVGRNATLGNSNFPKADLSFTPNRGLIALKEDTSRNMAFQFNPEEVTDDKSVVYEDKGKTGLDVLDFLWIQGGARTVEFTLQFDATEGSRQTHLGKEGGDTVTRADGFTHDPTRGVLNQVEFLQALMRPKKVDVNTPVFVRGNVQTSEQFQPPPEIIFVYGYFYFEGVIVRASPTYTLWSRELVPLRASMSVAIRVMEGQSIQINQDLVTLSGQGFNVNT